MITIAVIDDELSGVKGTKMDTRDRIRTRDEQIATKYVSTRSGLYCYRMRSLVLGSVASGFCAQCLCSAELIMLRSGFYTRIAPNLNIQKILTFLICIQISDIRVKIIATGYVFVCFCT